MAVHDLVCPHCGASANSKVQPNYRCRNCGTDMLFEDVAQAEAEGKGPLDPENVTPVATVPTQTEDANA